MFISEKPVKREIFWAAFRDRVVDTIFVQRFSPLLEQEYIDDNYSTRVGKLYRGPDVEWMCWLLRVDIMDRPELHCIRNSRRTLAACIDKIERYNRLAQSSDGYAERHIEVFTSVMNSYLGMMRHFSSYNQVCKLVQRIDPEWYRFVYVILKYKKYKVCIRKPYRVNVRQRVRLDAELDILFNNKKKK